MHQFRTAAFRVADFTSTKLLARFIHALINHRPCFYVHASDQSPPDIPYSMILIYRFSLVLVTVWASSKSTRFVYYCGASQRISRVVEKKSLRIILRYREKKKFISLKIHQRLVIREPIDFSSFKTLHKTCPWASSETRTLQATRITSVFIQWHIYAWCMFSSSLEWLNVGVARLSIMAYLFEVNAGT